ncbi:MAG: dockerin type I repeat-containing protein, partial [Ruminococcus callidus]|nr:dockerin type I repeat-containing protein [Ruminococcus callidus]
VTDYGKKVEKLDNVSYCKTIGYGAPEEAGGVNTLYMYGKPQESDVEGVYRSTDAGKTWVLINSEHLYGGTGNGNFLVGDMNEFGTVYMSTVGCGIVYMQSAAGSIDPKPTTTTTTTTTETGETTTTTETTTETGETTTTVETTTETGETTTTTSDVVTTTSDTTPIVTVEPGNDDLIGDVNVDGKVDLTDAICMNKYLAGQMELGEQAMRNANCNQADGTPPVDEADGNALISFVIMLITELPEQVTLE